MKKVVGLVSATILACAFISCTSNEVVKTPTVEDEVIIEHEGAEGIRMADPVSFRGGAEDIR